MPFQQAIKSFPLHHSQASKSVYDCENNWEVTFLLFHFGKVSETYENLWVRISKKCNQVAIESRENLIRGWTVLCTLQLCVCALGGKYPFFENDTPLC